MKDMAKLNDDLREQIVTLIQNFEKEHNVEFTVMQAHSRYSRVEEKNEIGILLGLKDNDNSI
jgi:hypothetical protein